MDVYGPLNVVLGTSQAGGGDYQTTTAGTDHTINVNVPAGKHVTHAWYVPIDNLIDIPAFASIWITAISTNALNLHLKQHDNGRQGLLRILIFYVTN
jgi:hypothetical protein